MNRIAFVSTALLLAGGLTNVVSAQTSEASVQANVGGNRQPLEFSQRPLTVPRNTVRIDGDLTFAEPGDPFSARMDLGGGYGITDDFEAGAIIAPVEFLPDPGYARPVLYAMYRLTQGNFEFAPYIRASLPFRSGRVFGINAGANMLIRFGNARLDLQPNFVLDFRNGVEPVLFLPVRFTLNVSESVFVGLQTGFHTQLFSPVTMRVPLGGRAGVTVPGPNGPMMDLYGSFGFPGFATIVPSPPADGDSTFIDTSWRVGVGIDFYLYL